MASEALTASRPYAPSWFDALKAVLERATPPWWSLYLVATVGAGSGLLAVEWAIGLYPVGVVNPFHVFLAVLPVLALWYMHFLDRVAGRALDQMAPRLNVDRHGLDALRHQLTTMPARPVLLLTISGALIVTPLAVVVLVLDPSLLTVFGFSASPAALAVFVAMMTMGYATGAVFLFHTLRQLRLVSRVYRHDVVVDLVDLGSIYAFSRLTALTAVGLQVQADLWIVTNPAAVGALAPVLSVTLLTALAGVVFIVPLWGIHQRIAAEKGRLLGVNAGARETVMEQLREGVAAGDLGRVTPIKDAVLAFDVEAKSLATIRTWPWEPETLRLLLTAILLPTALFVVQYVVRVILGVG